MCFKLVQSATTSIEATSSRQAMDWALVATSQAIECSIEFEANDGVWLLVFASEADHDLAAEAIRAYERENTTAWRQEVKWTGLLFDWRSLFWWAFIIVIFVFGQMRSPVFVLAGSTTPAVRLGEWWRAFTAVTLHADVAHLALNASIGFVLLGLTMGFYGPGKSVLSTLMAGAAANALGAFFRIGPYQGVGASGMVMAALGMLGAQSMFERHHSAREWIGRGALGSGLLLAIIGLDQNSDVLAHVLGFLCGSVAGILLCLNGSRLLHNKALDMAAGFAAAGLIMLTWVLALWRAHV